MLLQNDLILFWQISKQELLSEENTDYLTPQEFCYHFNGALCNVCFCCLGGYSNRLGFMTHNSVDETLHKRKGFSYCY